MNEKSNTYKISRSTVLDQINSRNVLFYPYTRIIYYAEKNCVLFDVFLLKEIRGKERSFRSRGESLTSILK